MSLKSKKKSKKVKKRRLNDIKRNNHRRLHDPQNRREDGSVKWNWVDSDLWLHPDSKVYTDQEKIGHLDNFPDEEVPVWGEFTPRVTHPLP